MRWRRPTPTGNIQQAMQGEPQTYKKGGVLAAADGVTYEHDRDGNRTAKMWPDGRRETYTWSAAGRLVAVTKADGKVVRFEYDALGRRVKKTSDAEEQTWIWDGDVPLHELSTREGPIAWVFEPGTFTPAAKVQGLRRWAIVTDQVGAPCAAFDEWGGVAWQGEVDVYGKAAADVEKTAVPWRFPGQYEDAETGLFYNRFRYYDPETGRYTSKDPIGLLGGIEAYGYVPDPAVASDPLGLAIVYHYTSAKGFKAITAQRDWLFKASKPPGDHPYGAYFTTLPPTHKNLAAKLGGLPREKVEYYFQMDIPDSLLKPLRGGRGEAGVSVYHPADLTVRREQQIAHGKRCK
ncbi:RHS repeat-associated core domain-containing protein [Polyangium jinanense]|nr:RHS repeat-associated core domain-containing protein [Polyangium jinanense]